MRDEKEQMIKNIEYLEEQSALCVQLFKGDQDSLMRLAYCSVEKILKCIASV